LTVKFLKACPGSFVYKIQNYYFSAFDSVYTLFPDSANLPAGKGFGDRLHKNVITKALFWHLIFGAIIFTGFLLFVKKIWQHFVRLPHLTEDSDGKSHKIRYIGKIIFFGFLASIIFHWIKSLVFGAGYPNNTFLFYPADRFHDFLGPYSQAKDLPHYLMVNNYYPVANVVFYLFTFLPRVESLALFLTAAVLCFFYINVSSLALKNRKEYITNAFIFSFLTYPFLFVIDRANIEIFLFVFLYFFIYFCMQKRFFLSAVLLFFAIGMKAYPAVFLVLLLSEKKYRVAVTIIILLVLAVLGSFLFHKGVLPANLNFMLSVFNANSYSFTMQNNVLQRGVSLFTLLKLIFIQFNLIGTIDMVKFLALYLKIVFCLFVVLAGYVIFIEKEFWKKTAILTFAMLLLPHISADYKLVHLFIPMLLFINSPKRDKSDLFYAIMFGLLLIPKDYYGFSKIISDSNTNDISIAVVLNILIMLIMTGMIIKDGFKNKNRSCL
jgi:hypothetical protein